VDFPAAISFTQVLQTEGGRPMTIQLFATSSKAVSWPSRLGTGLLGLEFSGEWWRLCRA